MDIVPAKCCLKAQTHQIISVCPGKESATVVSLGHTYVLFLKIRFRANGLRSRENGLIIRANGIRSRENGLVIRANEIRSRENGLIIRANEIRYRENELIIHANGIRSRENG